MIISNFNSVEKTFQNIKYNGVRRTGQMAIEKIVEESVGQQKK